MMTPEARYIFEQLPQHVQQVLRPSLGIRTTPVPIEQISTGQSRIGGIPDLPEGFLWPSYDGRPLSFIAQLNLAEIATYPRVFPAVQPPDVSQGVLPIPDLPERKPLLLATGSLLFFYDSEQKTWGFDPNDEGSARVIHISDSNSELRRTPPPKNMVEWGQFPSCAVEFLPQASLPVPRTYDFVPALSKEEQRRVQEFHKVQKIVLGSAEHRLGGYATCIQNAMELECQLVTNGLYCGNSSGYTDPRVGEIRAGAKDWILLLQIDTDANTDMMWGDCGMIYYWMRRQDLLAGDFEGIWLVLQCC
jgi:uncharacterized protein YwqG